MNLAPRHPYENRYCNRCRKTVSHEVKNEGAVYTCQICGSEKRPSKVQKRASDSWFWRWFK